MTTFSAMFSMIIGLYLWILTLKTKDDFAPLWMAQSAAVQDLMETTVSNSPLPPPTFPLNNPKLTPLPPPQFSCCGYFNSSSPAFVTNPTCPSPAAAALMRGCATPITSFANIFIDDIFTAVFGMVGIDAVFVMATACLLKERKERERFRHIDEKSRGAF